MRRTSEISESASSVQIDTSPVLDMVQMLGPMDLMNLSVVVCASHCASSDSELGL